VPYGMVSSQDQFHMIMKQYKNKSQAGLLHFVLNSIKKQNSSSSGLV
jgi:hypothetical protein